MNINELRNSISRHQQIYYNGGAGGVDDSVYDSWIRDLRTLSPDDPLLSAVGAPVPSDSTLNKVQHKHHMGSIESAMTEEKFLKWHNAIRIAHIQVSGMPEPLYNVSYKMDGASAELVYEDGVLVQASTRGDGQWGEDITANVLRMQGVPRYVKVTTDDQCASKGGKFEDLVIPFTGFVRGEIMLEHEEFAKLDDPENPTNPRNLGNGMARRKDGEGCEHLNFVAFRGFGADGEPLGATEKEMLRKLDDLGFAVVPHCCNLTLEKVKQLHGAMLGEGLDYMTMMDEPAWTTRDDLPYEIDGLVVKIEDIALQLSLGEASNCPRGQIAWKFPPKGAPTILRDVEWTVGHTGALIPTGVVMPVRIGGVTVSRALLCNMEEIARLGVTIGDSVRIVRAGDVIPKITELIREGPALNRKQIEAPAKCPVCGGVVGKKKGVSGDEGVHLYCLNPECEAKQLGKIKTWIKKLDILGLGDVFIDELFQIPYMGGSGGTVLQSVADLYRWKDDPAAYGSVQAVLGKSRAAKVLAQIEKKRELSLSDFLGSLGIEGLGRRRVQLVQQALPGQFDDIRDWAIGRLVDKAAEVGLPNTAKAIHDQIMENMELIRALFHAGVTIKKEKPMTQETPKEGQLTFVLTGKFPNPKAFYHDAIAAAGHRFESDYKKGISYLVTASEDTTSNKAKKAAKDGVPMITADKLMEMLTT